MSRRDYSIPDCPKIGRYDGLGMAAVPLAIADKERELGINNSYYDTSTSSHSNEKLYTEEELSDKINKARSSGYKAGKEKGYSEGYTDGYRKGKIDLYTTICDSKNYPDMMRLSTFDALVMSGEHFIKKYSK